MGILSEIFEKSKKIPFLTTMSRVDFSGLLWYYDYMNKLFFVLSKISLHPKLAAVLDLIFSLIFIAFLGRIGVGWLFAIWLILRLSLWVILVKLVFFPVQTKRFWHWLSLVTFFIGGVMLLLFIEWPLAWYLMTVALVVFPATSFWFLPVKDAELSFVFKPYRRWQFLSAVFGLAGVISGLFAIQAFQLFNILSRWPYIVVATIVSTAVAYWWWHEYGIVHNRRLYLWLLLWLLINIELLWILFLWPLGYLLLGILFVWIWYVLWLMVRFHLSKDGIVWKKQRWFLFVNCLALLIYLFFLARWQ